MKNQMFMLQNLNCPTCAAKLERAVRDLPGVKGAQVAFATGTLHIEYDPRVLSEDGIRGIIRELGLGVAAVMPGQSR